MTRQEILAQARAGEQIESAPVSYIRETTYFEYTARELNQDLAYDSAIEALRSLRATWKAENEARIALRELAAKWQAESSRQNDRERAIREALESKPVRRVPCDDIVTSAPDTAWLEAEPFELKRRKAEPFMLSRRTLKSKVAPKRRKIPALGNFFRAVAIFASA